MASLKATWVTEFLFFLSTHMGATKGSGYADPCEIL